MKRVIFLHGVGGNGAAMRPLARELALPFEAQFPNGPKPFHMGEGRQWFSVAGVSEANRPGRVAAALDAFRNVVESFGDPRDSLLIGFSQGAIMALHAVAAGMPSAGVFALSGRLAGAVAPRAGWPLIWLLHGSADTVMPPEIARETEGWFIDAGAAPRLQIFEGLGHVVDERAIEAIRTGVQLLQPQRPSDQLRTA